MLKPALPALLLAAVSLGAAPAAQPGGGYLSAQAAPDTLRILPPAPAPGSSRDQADRTIYRQTRAMKDGPRWALAHADIDQGAMLKDMACAVGVELTREN